MALRKIRYENDSILKKKSKTVKDFDSKLQNLIDDMFETLEAHKGLGLAAPQVGVLKRVVVITIDDNPLTLINPEIIETQGIQRNSEACLSIPNRSGKVERPEYVKIRAYDRNGEMFETEGHELMAVCFCHEIDHLDGILYTDKAISIDEDEDEEDE